MDTAKQETGQSENDESPRLTLDLNKALEQAHEMAGFNLCGDPDKVGQGRRGDYWEMDAPDLAAWLRSRDQ